MRSAPEVKTHLEAGKLTLTSAAQIRRFIKTEEKVASKPIHENEKAALVELCLDQSKREVEKTLLTQQSEQAKILTHEKVKLVTTERAEIKFTVGSETLKRMERIKELLGDKSLESIFDRALEALILKEEKKRGMDASQTQSKTDTQVQSKIRTRTQLAEENEEQLAEQDSENAPTCVKSSSACMMTKANTQAHTSNSRFIPIDMKRFVFKRSQGQCEFVHEQTQTRCTSRYRLQIDHVQPLALGGKTEIKNLRHLCMNHNLRAAMEMGIA